MTKNQLHDVEICYDDELQATRLKVAMNTQIVRPAVTSAGGIVAT